MGAKELHKTSKEYSGFRLLRDLRRDPLHFFTNLMNKEGDFAWLNLNGIPLLVLHDALGVEHVLQNNAQNYRKGRFNKVLKYFLGKSMFLSEGDVWRKLRHDSAPAFANANFNAMHSFMVEAVEAMFARWEPRIANGTPIDISAEMMELTLDVVLRSLFHESRIGVAEQLQQALALLLSESERRIWSPFNLPQSIVLQMPKYRPSLMFLRELVSDLVRERKANRAYPDDLLSRLIKHYDVDAEARIFLRDQVMAFLLAGHETTAHGLSWSIYNLALHPYAQRTLLGELETVLGSQAPSLDEVKELKFTRQIFDEALRLYPPVWTLSRESYEADTIPLESGASISIPKDTVVMLCCYAVQRREKYWENPDAFDPDRFAPDVSALKPKFAWFPFGGGPRLCLGFRFAQIESVTALSMIYRRYNLTMLPGQLRKPVPVITLRPDAPMLFKITKRPSCDAYKPHTETDTNAPIENAAPARCPFHHEAAE